MATKWLPTLTQTLLSSAKTKKKSLDSEICKWCRETGDESGSTALITCYDAHKRMLHVGSVGDSRCVLSIDGQAKVVSMEQHRLACIKERERVEAAVSQCSLHHTSPPTDKDSYSTIFYA